MESYEMKRDTQLTSHLNVMLLSCSEMILKFPHFLYNGSVIKYDLIKKKLSTWMSSKIR